MVLAVLLLIRTKAYKLAGRRYTMSVPGAEGDDTACPVCGSENTEEQEAVNTMAACHRNIHRGLISSTSGCHRTAHKAVDFRTGEVESTAQ